MPRAGHTGGGGRGAERWNGREGREGRLELRREHKKQPVANAACGVADLPVANGPRERQLRFLLETLCSMVLVCNWFSKGLLPLHLRLG